jgi:SHS2 domain-containing protein
VQPVERPPYRLETLTGGVIEIEVEAADWAGLLGAAALALSDALRPLGAFDTWTARRVSARGKTREEVLERWLGILVGDANSSGFLPVLAEVDRAEEHRASGIHRGGIAPETEGPPARRVEAIVAGSVRVEPGEASRAWRAVFQAR